MEFKKEELEYIKDLLDGVSHIDHPNKKLLEVIWNKMDDAGIEDTYEHGDSFERYFEDYISKITEQYEQSDGCDNYTYDCQDMPDEVRQEFFDGTQAGNDCHVTFYVDADDLVSTFLMEELGCEPGDEVIVKHWW